MEKNNQLIGIQKKETEMLKAFIEVCENLGLKYYAIGGTLLGAVRHNGFIPWDDDIDVGMPRKDYEIFLSKAQDMLPKNFFVQSFITDPEYPANFAKIRNSDTTFIESSVKNRKINHGVYIDIFPLDDYPDSKRDLKKFNFLNLYYKAAIAKSFYIPKKKRNWKWFAIRIATVFISIKTALKKREKLISTQKGDTYYASFCSNYGLKNVILKEWYGEGVTLEFEGLNINAPTNYEAYLNQMYGDYMKLPPEEKRIAHHFNEVVDLDKSYKEYIK